MPSKLFFILGALSAFLGVAIGAFGAHGLKSVITPERLATFETGNRYHMFHSFALFAVAWAITRWNSNYLTISGWSFIAGILLFSGSLYILSITGIRWLGAITPIGGVAFLAGWLLLAWGVYKG